MYSLTFKILINFNVHTGIKIFLVRCECYNLIHTCMYMYGLRPCLLLEKYQRSSEGNDADGDKLPLSCSVC